LNSSHSQSLADLLADAGSSAPAIISTAPSVVVSYKSLAEQIERLSGQLRSAGLKPGDRVAIVLPNSLEFLVVFLALTRARLVAAPLNPASKPAEIRFFIEDSQARAIVADGANTTVREASAGLGLPIWQPRVGSRGVVELPDLPAASRTTIDVPGPDDVAVFSYSSGTTGRPKCVPLTHANVLWSSRNIAEHYVLTSADCVNRSGGADPSPTVLMKDARYDKLIEAFDGTGYHVTDPRSLTKALTDALASGKPTLINCVIDPTAGTESGHLQNLNPQSQVSKGN
jgi:acyl-CoA synthetase (AMP-forming)/AMP-acid ligase II